MRIAATISKIEIFVFLLIDIRINPPHFVLSPKLKIF